MSRYIPMPAYPDMMPVDISFVFEDEKPAGKHGFLKVVGEEFRFEDGTPGKFWGVNINGGANFPEHDYAEKFARRLAQVGCNIVRLHQLDAEWGIPNIFSFTRGKRLTTTRKLDPQSMDRLDYLLYCLKEQGIYAYLDMNTYRKFKEGDGVVDAAKLPDVGKPYNMIDPHMIELQKEYAVNLWTHYNPYTKLAYKDDPMFVMTELIAECDLFADTISNRWWHTIPEYYDRQYRNKLRQWLEANNIEYDWEHCDLYEKTETLYRFKVDVTRDLFNELREHLISIGVKIPITGTNWVTNHAMLNSHTDMDFTDAHGYYYDWRWANNERLCKHATISSGSYRGALGWLYTMTVAGMPFYQSEWDMPWPNAFRAEGAIYQAAITALQGWGGSCIHTYSYGTRLDEMKVLGREVSSPISGIPYREGIFSTWNDPAKFGLFYHAALITRRGDVSPANKRIAIKPHDPKLIEFDTLAYGQRFETHRVRTCFSDELPEGYDELVLDNERFAGFDPNNIVSDNGQMWRKSGAGIGGIDTERTKCFYGMLGAGFANGSVKHYKRPVQKMNGLEIECATDFGVIALSSLTDEPIENSDNILLSAIGRACNTDAQFDGDKMLKLGTPPIQAEVIDSIVRVKHNDGENMYVWGINAEGYYAGRIPTTYEDGWLSFRIGDENNPACYYLIVKE